MKAIKTILILALVLLIILFPLHILSWVIVLGITLLALGFGIAFLGLLFVQIKEFFGLFSSKYNSNINSCNSNNLSYISDDEALVAYYLLKKRKEQGDTNQD